MRQMDKRLNEAQLQEVCNIMVIGNTALKQCAEMMDMTHREFRGKLFSNKLDTSKLTPEQLETLKAAKPLIFAVRDQCETKVRANFKRLVEQQSWMAAKNNYDPYNAKEEFRQEGEIAVLDGIYGYSDTKIRLSTYIWQCVRRRVMDAINRLNPLCPLTNEALDLVRRVQELQKNSSEILTDEQAISVLGYSSEESDVFFGSITKVMNEESVRMNVAVGISSNEASHADDYTANRRGVDRDFKEVFFIRKDARQALKDANLDDFELAILFGDTFPYHGWKEDIASKHINPRTKERFTRQNVQYALERAKNKVREAYLNPPKIHRESPLVDKFFDEWDAERAVREDRK